MPKPLPPLQTENREKPPKSHTAQGLASGSSAQAGIFGTPPKEFTSLTFYSGYPELVGQGGFRVSCWVFLEVLEAFESFGTVTDTMILEQRNRT